MTTPSPRHLLSALAPPLLLPCIRLVRRPPLTLLSQKKVQCRLLRLRASSSSSSPEADLQTAETCVNLGLSFFSKGRVKEALTQFETALSLNPNPAEAQAALYNKACCHAYRYVTNPQKCWKETIKNDLAYCEITANMAHDRDLWKQRIHVADPV